MVTDSGQGIATVEEAKFEGPTLDPKLRRGHRSPGMSILLHTSLIVATAVIVFPLFWIFLTSFKPNNEIYVPEIQFISDNPTLDNYKNVLQGDFPTWFLNSVIVSSLTMLIGLIVSATSGYALSRFNAPGRRSMLWILLVTQMFPVAILIVPIYNIMNNLGLLNTYFSLVFAYLTTAIPFCTWMLKGYFDTIPKDIDEAGLVDGLTPFGTFWRLILPLARPGLAVTMFYTFLTAWGEVAYATAFITDSSKYTLAVGLQTYVSQFTAQWGLMTAASVMIAVPAVIVFLLVQKNLVAGLTAGGTKG